MLKSVVVTIIPADQVRRQKQEKQEYVGGFWDQVGIAYNNVTAIGYNSFVDTFEYGEAVYAQYNQNGLNSATTQVYNDAHQLYRDTLNGINSLVNMNDQQLMIVLSSPALYEELIAPGPGEIKMVKKIGSLSKSQIKAVESLKKNIKIHKEKLDLYKANPDAYDNKSFLQNAPSEEIRQNIIESRINHLEGEIRTFEKNIEKILNE